MSQVLAQTTNAITTNAFIAIMIQMEREDLGLVGSSDIATQCTHCQFTVKRSKKGPFNCCPQNNNPGAFKWWSGLV